MTHYNDREWDEYVGGRSADGHAMEEHLAHCDQCLAAYLSAVERQAEPPSLSDERQFVAAALLRADVAEQAALETAPLMPRAGERASGKQPLYANKLIQYIIAASITIILVGSGAFQHMIDSVSDLTASAENDNKQTVTSKMSDAANSWLDIVPAIFLSRNEANP